MPPKQKPPGILDTYLSQPVVEGVRRERRNWLVILADADPAAAVEVREIVERFVSHDREITRHARTYEELYDVLSSILAERGLKIPITRNYFADLLRRQRREARGGHS